MLTMKKLIAYLLSLLLCCAPASAQFSAGGGGPGGTVANVVATYAGAGNNVATTGTIAISTNSLTSVASTAGWSVGMGVAIANAGTGGNTELIGCVGGISGTTFSIVTCGTTTPLNAIATATTQAVNHDDTYAISQAIASGLPVYLPHGNYNVTSGQTINSVITFAGDGSNQSIIYNRSKTAFVFTVGYSSTLASETTWQKGALFRDFGCSQAFGITPTAGGCFSVATAGGANTYVTGLVITRIVMNALWSGIAVGNGTISNWFTDIYMTYFIGGWGIDYNAASPAGDAHFNDIEMTGTNTGFRITSADTFEATNLKINQSGLLFNGASTANAAGPITRVRFVNPSIEGAFTSTGCGVDFGSNGAWQVTFIGGEIAGWATAFCNANNNTVGSANTVIGNVNSTQGNGIINAEWPRPVFSGCGTNGTATGDALHGSVTMTCAAATMVMTFNSASADNGWKCDVRDITNPTDLIAQTGFTASTATFATITTGSAATLVYSCTSW
jgi:hypothetical protein